MEAATALHNYSLEHMHESILLTSKEFEALKKAKDAGNSVCIWDFAYWNGEYWEVFMKPHGFKVNRNIALNTGALIGSSIKRHLS